MLCMNLLQFGLFKLDLYLSKGNTAASSTLSEEIDEGRYSVDLLEWYLWKVEDIVVSTWASEKEGGKWNLVSVFWQPDGEIHLFTSWSNCSSDATDLDWGVENLILCCWMCCRMDGLKWWWLMYNYLQSIFVSNGRWWWITWQKDVTLWFEGA